LSTATNAAESDGKDSVDLSADSRPTGPAFKKRGLMFWLHTVAFALGVALLIFLVQYIGVQPIFDALKRVGLGFFPVLLLIGLRHALRTIAMSISVPKEHRGFNFRQAFAARLGGEAISVLTFTGPILGEATKVALLKKRVPLSYGVSALVVDNLLYNLSVVFFILSGATVMLFAYPLPLLAWYVLVGIATVATIGILLATIAASHRIPILSLLIDCWDKLGRLPTVVVRRREYVSQLESNIYDFYESRTGAFFAILAFDFLSHVASVIEVFVVLKMLGSVPPVKATYIIESLTKVINFVFGFVPATIGVYEGGNALILQTLGFTAATGLALALVRKAGLIVWTLIGLLILAGRAVPEAGRRLAQRSSAMRKIMDSLVFSNITHRPARTLVSIAGIGVGVLLIVFTVGLAHGMLRERGRRESNIGVEIMVRAPGSLSITGSQPFNVPVSLADEIAKIPGVRAAVPLAQNFDKSDSGFGSRMIEGIEFEPYARATGITLKEGRPLRSGDEAIVDTVWQQEHHAAIGSIVRLYERPFTVVGIYEPPGGGRIKIPLSTMQEQMGGEGHATTILVACNNPAEQNAVAARIRERFPDNQIIFTRDLPELYASGLPALNVFLNVVVGVAAAISMLVILLAMYTTVTERTRQIGILKSLGMSKTTIAWVIEQEAIIVSVLGVVCGILLTLIFRFAVMRTTTLTIEIEPKWLIISLGVGLVGGSIGALYPAVRAARQDAVDALSYE
jgi:putative ABC transport system permease protein